MADLTDRQRQILVAMHAAIETNGYPPTVRELGAAVGLASPAAVSRHIEVLHDLGFIKKTPGTPRGLVVLLPPPDLHLVTDQPEGTS